jgi:hypothetical protein
VDDALESDGGDGEGQPEMDEQHRRQAEHGWSGQEGGQLRERQ